MPQVVFHCFPVVDRAFARAVAETLSANRRASGRAPVDPVAFQRALRERYPDSVVSPQEALARLGDPRPLWYVFRDGGLASASHAPRRVLVVDDDPAFAQMLEAMLQGAGFEVRQARDGAEGLAVASDFAPNLILLDLAMPNVDGEEFAARYRADPEATAQIVVISGMPDAWKRAQATDARAVLPKPFEMDSFLAIMRQFA